MTRKAVFQVEEKKEIKYDKTNPIQNKLTANYVLTHL